MRLFIGVSPDEAARASLGAAAGALRATIPGQYADMSLYHLTLAFLGERGLRDIPEIVRAMREAATGVSAFCVPFSGFGRFGEILFCGLAESAPLASLAARLRAALDSSAIAYDAKPFRAHITLARGAAESLGPLPKPPECPFPVSALILYESTRAGGVLRYLPRARVGL